MQTNRLEAFSDGVMAIIITIMAFSVPLPKEITTESITELVYAIGVFFVSFIVIGAQWEKHHWLFSKCETVSSKVIWRNILYLFFLSLMPLFTKWIMENPKVVAPAIAYNIVYIAVFATFHIMQNTVVKENENLRVLFEKLRNERHSSKFSFIFFGAMLAIIAIFVLSLFYPTVSIIFFIGLPVASSLFNLWSDKRVR